MHAASAPQRMPRVASRCASGINCLRMCATAADAAAAAAAADDDDGDGARAASVWDDLLLDTAQMVAAM